VEAALALIDEAGLSALSMRKLGARLGVEAMTLYHYVPNKDALLDLVVERVAMSAAAAGASTSADWRDRLAHFARRYRAQLISHPKVLPLISTRPLRSPEALGEFSQALAQMVGQGFTPKDAYFALQAVAMLVIGMAIAEAGEPAPGAEPQAEPATEAPVEGGYAAALQGLFGEAQALDTRHQDGFEFALAALLDGLNLRRNP
jgi:TetR/AcrR family tetracycline transcriptional repressor